MGSGGLKHLPQGFRSLSGNSHSVMTGKKFQFRMVMRSPIDGDFERGLKLYMPPANLCFIGYRWRNQKVLAATKSGLVAIEGPGYLPGPVNRSTLAITGESYYSKSAVVYCILSVAKGPLPSEPFRNSTGAIVASPISIRKP